MPSTTNPPKVPIRANAMKATAKFFKFSPSSLVACLAIFLVGCHSASDTVSLADKREQAVLVSADKLSEYEWRLAEANGALSSFVGAVRLDFKGDKLSFDAGCNVHTGAFALNQESISLDSSRLSATRRACEPERHQAEAALVRALSSSKLSLTVSEDRTTATLTQTAKSQDKARTLRWYGTKKLEKISKPVMVYWEIDPEPTICADDTSVHCLKIRHIRYNDDGIQVGKGAWQNFEGDIKNYTHHTNMRSIVRLKAYQDAANPDQPIYVYDETVESSIIK